MRQIFFFSPEFRQDANSQFSFLYFAIFSSLVNFNMSNMPLFTPLVASGSNFQTFDLTSWPVSPSSLFQDHFWMFCGKEWDGHDISESNVEAAAMRAALDYVATKVKV